MYSMYEIIRGDQDILFTHPTEQSESAVLYKKTLAKYRLDEEVGPQLSRC